MEPAFRTILVVSILSGFVAACVRTGNVPDASTTGFPNATSAINPPASTETLAPTPGLSPEARAYLEQALAVMQAHSINRYQIDWDALRSEAYILAAGAQSPADTYNAIRIALTRLEDHHSFFMPPFQVTPLPGEEATEALKPYAELLRDRIGYIFLPGFSGSTEAAEDYAATVQQSIRQIDADDPCGWMIDLRQNTGGNMWPMLAGIGPLLGEGQLGSFVYPDGHVQAWSYLNGQARLDDMSMLALSDDRTYQVQKPNSPLAVLTGPRTASSGEAIVVALRGRPITRSFGQATAGRSTSNQGFTLSDGATIALTVAAFADRYGQIYGGKIAPDQAIVEEDPSTSQAIPIAGDWLLDQPPCIGKE